MQNKATNETGQSELPGRAPLAGVLDINGMNGAFKSFEELYSKPCGALQYLGALAFALAGALKLSALDGLRDLAPSF